MNDECYLEPKTSRALMPSDATLALWADLGQILEAAKECVDGERKRHGWRLLKTLDQDY